MFSLLCFSYTAQGFYFDTPPSNHPEKYKEHILGDLKRWYLDNPESALRQCIQHKQRCEEVVASSEKELDNLSHTHFSRRSRKDKILFQQAWVSALKELRQEYENDEATRVAKEENCEGKSDSSLKTNFGKILLLELLRDNQ
jgi:hypothetical protein